MRLHGGVVGVTDFAAFVDVQVVRKGAGGRVRTTTTGHGNRRPFIYHVISSLYRNAAIFLLD